MVANKDVSRRNFLTGAAATAACLTAESRAGAFSLMSLPDDLPAEHEVPTFCELCFWNCGVVARTRKGRVLSLAGHKEYPTSAGRLLLQPSS